MNPVAAGIASAPEASDHTSIKQRVDHARKTAVIATLQQSGEAPSAAGTWIEGDIEQSCWFCPIQDRRRQGSKGEGMLPGFSLAGYLELVDWTARMFRTGKAKISHEVASIMQRLGTNAAYWQARMKQLLTKSRWLGSFLATSRERLKEVAFHRGLHHVDNAITTFGSG